MRTPCIAVLAGTLAGLGLLWGCGYDDTLREYLDAHFWLPFSKRPWHFERKNVRRISRAFAGMTKVQGNSPLAKLRAAYQEDALDAEANAALAAARAEASLTLRDREEVALIDAKIDMRAGEDANNDSADDRLRMAQTKLEKFLRTARTQEFLSEARGWLAHIHYLNGEQAAAGKIYLDELNRNGSNLSQETLLNSLQLTYGYDGGDELRAHLEEYFDTPEHAAFAIQLITNPHWSRDARRQDRRPDTAAGDYPRIKSLLESHADLLKTEAGVNALAMLSMRTALRMGDPPEALKIAETVAAASAIRSEPDFDWMLASAHFLSRDYAAAEQPLLSLFQSSNASADQKAAAAYGLCGVYQKIGHPVEQIRFALWLQNSLPKGGIDYDLGRPAISDQSVYWAVSGWDLGLLLDQEAPTDALEAFVAKYPDLPGVRTVKYSLAVRYARENRYDESAEIYRTIHAVRRAPRMRTLSALYREATRTGGSQDQLAEAKYKLAEFLIANSERIYFNDALWHGFQREALSAATDSRLTRQERDTMIAGERKLQDDQEERWRAWLLLREVVRDAGTVELRRKAALLGLRSLNGISERFERRDEIQSAQNKLLQSLRATH